VSAEAAVAEFLKRHDGTRNLYYSLNPTKMPMHAKAKKSDIAAAEFIHVDIDPLPSETPQQAKARILKIAERFEPRPSAAIDSGNGIQLLWRLAEPVARAEEIEPYNRAMIAAFNAGAGTHNCDRILRLPGTTNLPNKKKLKEGRTSCLSKVIWIENTVCPLSAFKAATDPREEYIKRTNSAWQNVETEPPRFDPDNVSIDTLPGATDELKKIIREGCYERFGHDRSRAVFHVARELLKTHIPELLVERILLNQNFEISAHVRAQGNSPRAAIRAIANAKTSLETFVKTNKGQIIADAAQNVRIAVAQLGIALSYCSFSDRVLISGLDGFGPELDDHAVDRIWLHIEEKFRFRPTKEFLRTVIIDEAVTKFRFHPVRDYLDAVAWDGTPRIDTWLIKYGGAKDTPYIRAIGAIMLIAAVRRVRKPGCKFDELPVFESPTQGTDKSTAINVLAVEDEWFTDHLPLNADPKVVIEQTRGKWIIEAGELSGMRRGDIDKLKGLLSRRTDRGRLAYARLASEVPRQFVVIGTTNNREYLKDQTGNRRFWPVTIQRFDVAALKRDRDHLWGEASAREVHGESIRLDPNLWDAAGIEQAERTVMDPYRETLEHYLGDYENARIASHDIWKLLEMRGGYRSQDMNARMGDAIRSIGFERKKVRISGKVVNGYIRGEGRDALGVVIPLPDKEGGGDMPEPCVYVRGGDNDPMENAI
jgi:hypothetical protein